MKETNVDTKQLKSRELLYRLMISQLLYDGHQSLADNLSSLVQADSPCPPSNRLLHITNAGLIISQLLHDGPQSLADNLAGIVQDADSYPPGDQLLHNIMKAGHEHEPERKNMLLESGLVLRDEFGGITPEINLRVPMNICTKENRLNIKCLDFQLFVVYHGHYYTDDIHKYTSAIDPLFEVVNI